MSKDVWYGVTPCPLADNTFLWFILFSICWTFVKGLHYKRLQNGQWLKYPLCHYKTSNRPLVQNLFNIFCLSIFFPTDFCLVTNSIVLYWNTVNQSPVHDMNYGFWFFKLADTGVSSAFQLENHNYVWAFTYF